MLFEIDVSHESTELETIPVLDEPGHLFQHTVEAFLRGHSDRVHVILDFMLRYKHVVVLQKSNGNFIRIGDMINGLSFEFTYISSKEPSGRNGYQLKFKGHSLHNFQPVKYPFTLQ